MADPVTIPSAGFARGAVVRHKDGGPNMLVVRQRDTGRTVVVVINGDCDGDLRMTDPETADLVQVLEAQTPS